MNTTPSDDLDRAEMERLAQDDDDALNFLMQRYGDRLFHYLIRLLQNETEAADLAQESFVRVYQNRRRFQSGKRFSTWLYAIATNLARDRLRWHARHPSVSIEPKAGEESGLKDTLPAAGPSPARTLDLEERATAVRRALAELPPELREPLILSEYEELSHAEIAAVLNCSAKAVEMRLYRARNLLRMRLGSLLHEQSFSD